MAVCQGYNTWHAVPLHDGAQRGLLGAELTQAAHGDQLLCFGAAEVPQEDPNGRVRLRNAGECARIGSTSELVQRRRCVVACNPVTSSHVYDGRDAKAGGRVAAWIIRHTADGACGLRLG